ncbi:MAG: dihydrolipoyl dehydrogenase [candidate division KSB1 bacterium]|nr:dihydrolipoyl dehydrogenase [candidate division KSB1 bacterium]MDZ7334284.1 dihydrolipoyl dehydrogenase [candidate division KSB1 bacterium]MDZ7356498.1 dihydrolipoyl dehydrogenase [candidate division KSB1 bacterium]MDZ7400505.1 dihydrolipoyl dehydrogenase [candidate division KSB1 bacterium]
MANNFDLAILGSGPGGYVAAVRAAQLGMKVAVVERDQLGGVCLNWGCIPTKALLKSADIYATLRHSGDFGITASEVGFDFQSVIKRSRQIADRMAKGVQYLFKQNNIAPFFGFGRIVDNRRIAVVDESGKIMEELITERIIIATGARPRTIPGVEIDGKRVISSKEAMALEAIPESMIVIGAGAIGVEFAYFYHTFGCKVTIVEMLPSLLPIEDREISDLLFRSFKKAKMEVHTNSMVKSVVKNSDGVIVTIESAGKQSDLSAQVALMAIGVRGNIEGIGIEELGIKVEKSFIQVNRDFQTTVPNIYAIGDVIGPPWLAHVASAEGVHCVERIAGRDVAPIDYRNIPGCTYCQPQVASIGLTEEQARAEGLEIKIGRFPFVASGKSIAIGERDGFVKLIFDARNDQLLGAHVIHAEAAELIGELAVIKSTGMTAHQLIRTVHAHPTLSEAIMEAAAAAYGEAIHV